MGNFKLPPTSKTTRKSKKPVSKVKSGGQISNETKQKRKKTMLVSQKRYMSSITEIIQVLYSNPTDRELLQYGKSPPFFWQKTNRPILYCWYSSDFVVLLLVRFCIMSVRQIFTINRFIRIL